MNQSWEEGEDRGASGELRDEGQQIIQGIKSVLTQLTSKYESGKFSRYITQQIGVRANINQVTTHPGCWLYGYSRSVPEVSGSQRKQPPEPTPPPNSENHTSLCGCETDESLQHQGLFGNYACTCVMYELER